MGNSDLRQLAMLESTPPEELSGKTVAIDAHQWLYKYITGMRWINEEEYTTDDGVEVPNLVGILRGVPSLLKHDIRPVFVFDGAADELKDDEIERRRDERETAEEELEEARKKGDEKEVKRLKARTTRLTPEIHETSRELLDRMDIPYIEAPGAGEAQAAHMAATGTVDAAMSSDYDALLFGSPVTIRDFSASDDAEVMDFEKTLSDHGITHAQLIDIGILCGTDYNNGVYRVGPKTALKGMKEHGSAEGLLEEREAEIEDLDAIRELFLNPPVEDIQVDIPTVENLDPDYDAIEQYTVDEWQLREGRVSDDLERLREATRKKWF